MFQLIGETEILVAATLPHPEDLIACFPKRDPTVTPLHHPRTRNKIVTWLRSNGSVRRRSFKSPREAVEIFKNNGKKGHVQRIKRCMKCSSPGESLQDAFRS
jgi:hypothetical protein